TFYRSFRRHHFHVLLAHPRQDACDAPCRARAGFPASGSVRNGRTMTPGTKALWVHLCLVVLLFALNFLLPEYHRGILSRVMVLSVFAMGYNLAFGYAGMLSLGHAMFFAAGLYGAGLTAYHLGWSVWPAFGAGFAAGTILAVIA